MSSRKAKRLPFGEQLFSARTQRGWSRAKLAKEAGLSENSLVRYEKAGIDDNGQYPPSDKLAKLCFVLGLNARDVLMGCLAENEFHQYSTVEQDVMGLPLYRALAEEGMVFAQSNLMLRSMVRIFLLEKDGVVSISDDELTVIKESFYEVSKKVEVDEDLVFYIEESEEFDNLTNSKLNKNGPE